MAYPRLGQSPTFITGLSKQSSAARAANSADERVEMIVEKRAAAEDAAGFREGKSLLSQPQGFDNAGHEFRELFGGGAEEGAGGIVAAICGVCDERKNLGEDAIGIGANLVLQIDPIAVEDLKNLVAEAGIFFGARAA